MKQFIFPKEVNLDSKYYKSHRTVLNNNNIYIYIYIYIYICIYVSIYFRYHYNRTAVIFQLLCVLSFGSLEISYILKQKSQS